MPIVTVGHSNKSLINLFDILKANGVTNLVDVRSKPVSRFGFNKAVLDAKLPPNGIRYHWRGESLGGFNPDFAKMADALDRLAEWHKDKVVALMCSEGQPCDCHRHHWLSQYLFKKHQLNPVHLLHTGEEVLASTVQFNEVDGLTKLL